MTLLEIFQLAVSRNASDVHFIVGKPPILRIDGELLSIENTPEITQDSIGQLVNEVLLPSQIERLKKEREIDTSYEMPNHTRFRINCHYEKNYLGLVARLIPAVIPSMEELMMQPIIYELTRKKQGLVLITGPTGCGKTTSLAAMLNLINQERNAHIITLEDPIEFVYQPVKSIIRQREVGTDTLSFAEGLKHALRQDPNVIMVGEMRDLETISTVLTLAETGHLVFATLHTNNASQTIDRVIDVFPPHQQNQIRLQLALVLTGVIAQQLLPRVDKGRVVAREIMIRTPAVANLILENKIGQIKNVIQTSANEEMITMDQSIQDLLAHNLISKEVANMYLVDGEVE